MRIRVINQNDWEKNYEFDKSIIRIGNQISCDIMLHETDIQPLQMQLVRVNENEIRYTMRFFGDNITITRGNQSFPAEKITPYNLLDGDKVSFSSYRLIFSMEDEKTRTRSSSHIEAEMFMPRRNLSPETPINGVVKLKNIGTEKACQFHMEISGIPNDCFQFSPLPYLYPGGSSSVGFVISHRQTRPEPGFHTVSITLTAQDDYFGEVLEFNQDIYVTAVFKNDFALVDDSPEIFRDEKRAAQIDSETESAAAENLPVIHDNDIINYDDADPELMNIPAVPSKPLIVGSNDAQKTDIFHEEIEEDPNEGIPLTARQKRQRMVVIRHDEENRNVFGDDDEEETAADQVEFPQLTRIPEMTAAVPEEEKKEKKEDIRKETKKEEPKEEKKPEKKSENKTEKKTEKKEEQKEEKKTVKKIEKKTEKKEEPKEEKKEIRKKVTGPKAEPPAAADEPAGESSPQAEPEKAIPVIRPADTAGPDPFDTGNTGEAAAVPEPAAAAGDVPAGAAQTNEKEPEPVQPEARTGSETVLPAETADKTDAADGSVKEPSAIQKPAEVKETASVDVKTEAPRLAGGLVMGQIQSSPAAVPAAEPEEEEPAEEEAAPEEAVTVFPETPAETVGKTDEPQETSAPSSVVYGKAKVEIPVFHVSDFSDDQEFEDEPEPTPEENKKRVVFVKGGHFDD